MIFFLNVDNMFFCPPNPSNKTYVSILAVGVTCSFWCYDHPYARRSREAECSGYLVDGHCRMGSTALFVTMKRDGMSFMPYKGVGERCGGSKVL